MTNLVDQLDIPDSVFLSDGRIRNRLVSSIYERKCMILSNFLLFIKHIYGLGAIAVSSSLCLNGPGPTLIPLGGGEPFGRSIQEKESVFLD